MPVWIIIYNIKKGELAQLRRKPNHAIIVASELPVRLLYYPLKLYISSAYISFTDSTGGICLSLNTFLHLFFQMAQSVGPLINFQICDSLSENDCSEKGCRGHGVIRPSRITNARHSFEPS